MKAINSKNQAALDQAIAKIEVYKNVPDQKIVWQSIAKQLAESKSFIWSTCTYKQARISWLSVIQLSKITIHNKTLYKPINYHPS